MMQKPSTELLASLAERVKPSDPDGANRLTQLKEAIESRKRPDQWSLDSTYNAWSYANIHALVAPDSIVEQYRASLQVRTDTLITLLEIIRNIAIFIPIIITWFGISQATAAYNELISKAVAGGQKDLYTVPFLYLWQQRFNNILPDYLTLSSIAIFDVILLFGIVCVTIIAYSLAHRSVGEKDEKAQQLRADINHALALAVLDLNARPQMTPENNLQQATNTLDETVRHMVVQMQQFAKQSTDRLDKMSQDMTNRLEALMRDAGRRQEQLAEETTRRFDRMTREVTGQFITMSTQITKQVDGVMQEVTRQVEAGKVYLKQLDSMSAGVTKTASEIQGAALALQKTNSTLITSINNLVMPTQEMAKQQGQLSAATQKAVELLQANAKNIGELITRQKEAAEELIDMSGTLVDGVAKLVTYGEGQSVLVQQQGGFVQQLQNEHQTQSQLINALAETTEGMKEALQELNKGAVSMRSMAVSMDEMMRMQAAIVQNPALASAVDLGRIAQGYQNASQLIESSGATLNASAIAMQRASQQLRDVLDKGARPDNNTGQDTIRRAN